MLDRTISTKFLTLRVSLQSGHPNFQKKFCFAQSGGHFEFSNFSQKIAKHKNAYILKTMLERADYADFGCRNSIRLKAEYFLNTLALTLYPFQDALFLLCKNIIFFFASDPLVFFLSQVLWLRNSASYF